MMLNIHLLNKTKSIWFIPCLLMSVLVLAHLFFQNYNVHLVTTFHLSPLWNVVERSAYLILMSLCGYWFFVRIIEKLFIYLNKTPFSEKYAIVSILLPFFKTLLKILTFLILFNLITQHLDLPDNLSFILNKISSILIIGAISAILFKLIALAEVLLLHHYTVELSGRLVERKIVTQTLILKRVAYSIVTVLTTGAILVLFDNVRTLGASVLTTAGVIGLVLTFTAQRSLGSIFSGLEIAMTQPLKIGDRVFVEGELGTVEEINFRSVIIKLWDWRRLVVPTSQFLEKSFQNWTRVEQTNLIGTVFLYVDFTTPVPVLRKKLYSILERTPLWDKNVATLQVNELQESAMQLKICASSYNADDASDLCALIREELIYYLVNNYPQSLPKTRTINLMEEGMPEMNLARTEVMEI